MACLAVCGAVGLQPNGPAHGVQAVGQHPAAVGFVLNGEIPAEKIQQIIAQAQLVPAIAGQIAPGHAVHIVHAVTVQRQLDHRKVGIRLFPEPRLDVIQAENHVVAVIHVLFMGNAVLLDQIHAEQLVPHVVKPRIHVQLAHVFGGAVLHRQGLGQGPRQLVSTVAPVPQHHAVQACLLLLQGRFQQAGGQHIVVVHKIQPLAAGILHAHVPGNGASLVDLMDDLKPAVLRGVPVAHRTGAIRAAVVHQDALPIGKGLGGEAVQAAGQQVLSLVYGDYNAHQRHGLTHFLGLLPGPFRITSQISSAPAAPSSSNKGRVSTWLARCRATGVSLEW